MIALHRVPVFGRHFERAEFKPRRDCASDQCPFAERFGALPNTGSHDGLGRFASEEIDAKAMNEEFFSCFDRKSEGCTAVPMPDLGCIDTMPMGRLALRQQIINGGRGGTPIDGLRITKGFAEIPTFGMRPQRQSFDNILGRSYAARAIHLELYARSPNGAAKRTRTSTGCPTSTSS